MIAVLRRFAGIARGERSMFVLINIAVNVVFLARSYLTMQVLDYRQLGLAALLQSIIQLIGLVQFGFLNGGYRILCSAPEVEARRVNNLIYALLAGLAIASLVVAVTLMPFVSRGDAQLVAILGAAGGVLVLTRTWMMNHMIAKAALKRLNQINFWSAIASLLPLALIPVFPLTACLAAIVAQPLTFVVAVMIADRSILPTRLEVSWPLARKVFTIGFVMFLTGIFLQVNLQIERWYITHFLGLEALGHFYLAILFITLFQMVPNSLDQIFLPSIVRAHAAGEGASVRHGMRRFFQVETGYCLIAAIALAAAAQPVTALLLPKYLPDLQYVNLVAPGLVLFTLASPLAIPFNVLNQYRFYFIGFGAGTLVTALAFFYASVSGGLMDLDEVAVVRSGVYGVMAAVIVLGFFRVTRTHPDFRFSPVGAFPIRRSTG